MAWMTEYGDSIEQIKMCKGMSKLVVEDTGGESVDMWHLICL